ncbi:MAG: hypothetical protein ACJ72N_24740 [Labedaea sp.]
MLLAIANGEIVHPTVTSFPTHYRHPEVTHIPIHGLPAMRSALAWVTARKSVAIHAFAAVADEIVAADDRKPSEHSAAGT